MDKNKKEDDGEKKPEKSKEKDTTDFLDGKKEEEWCDWTDRSENTLSSSIITENLKN